MAKQRQKKRRRKRHDPARQEAALHREEARRKVADGRRREAEAEERRKKRKKRLRSAALPVLGSAAVFAIGLTVFRSAPEVKNVVKTDAVEVMARAGYAEYGIPETETVPAPSCGVLDEAPTADAVYSVLGHGAVILWHDPADTATAEALAGVVAEWDSHVASAPLPEGTEIDAAVLATSFSRFKRYNAAEDEAGGIVIDDEVDRFVEIYRRRGASGLDAACPTGFDSTP